MSEATAHHLDLVFASWQPLFTAMRQGELPPTQAVYYQQWLVWQARKIVERMRHEGLQPDYTTLLQFESEMFERMQLQYHKEKSL